MTPLVLWIVTLAVAYLIGSVPTGYLLVRAFQNQDVRESGSGNIGATNVARSGGTGLGIATLVLDVLKGFVAVVFALLLLPNAVLARIALGQRMGRQLLVGSGIAMAGVGLLIVNQARANPAGPHQTLVGVLLTFAAILGSSVANVTQAPETARRDPMAAAVGVALLLGAGVDGVLAWHLTGPPAIEHRLGYAAGILYLALFASALAFPLYYGVLRVIGPAKASYSSVIVPVIEMLLSTLFEGYRWSPLAVAGAAVTAVGLVVALRARRPNR